jgi:gamma-glutamylputrescine oxidase
MTLSFWQRGDREAELEYDVAVVGGGVIGCSTAYWLRRLQPSLQIAIVDAGRIASGASGRNAGFLLQGTSQDYQADLEEYGPDRARRLWQFTRENRDLILSELDHRAFDAEASGSLTVAGSEKEDERLRTAVSRMRADGAPVAYIPPAETNRRLTSRGFFGGLYVPSGAMLNPVRFVRHIARASGADLLEGYQVISAELEEFRVRLETPVRCIRSRQTIFALNAYLPRLFPELGKYVRPVRAQMLATEPMLPRWLHIPAYSHEGFYYIRQTKAGVLLLGGARHLHVEEEVGYEDHTTHVLQADLETYLHEYFPQARGLRIQQRWSGVMGFSPDGLPVVGAVPGLPGNFWTAGFTGHGMGYGFRFGRLMAELALGYDWPEGHDLFTAERFAECRDEAAIRRRA